MKKSQKGVKNEFQGKIEPPYQKHHKLSLKSPYLVLTPPPPPRAPLGGEGGGGVKKGLKGVFSRM